MGNWQKKKLSDFLIQRKEQVELDPDVEYSLVTISNKGQVTLREKKKGALINAQKGYLVKPGDFIYSRLSVHTGAFGIVPDELDGALVTNEMPTFTIDEQQIHPKILIDVIGLPQFQWQLKQLTKGMGRVRIKENMMLALSVLTPRLSEQKYLTERLDVAKDYQGKLKSEITYQRSLLKKLRQQILQEAIEGKLTADWRAENPDVEHASELLKRIAAEKAQLVKDKKIKPQKPLPPISEEEKPFILPEGWAWCRLGDIIEELTDYHANGSYQILKQHVELRDKPNFAIMLRTTNFHKSSKFLYKYITKEAYEFLEKSKVYSGDVIMNKIADPGATFYVDDRGQPMSLAMNLFLIRFCKKMMNSKFSYYYLFASYGYIVSFSSGTATPTITKDAVRNLRFPLPAFKEQEAIVTKVEKLLALCDQLEEQISRNQTHAEQLMHAVLKEAFNNNASPRVAGNELESASA